MFNSSVRNSTSFQILDYGCNRSMGIFMSNENSKRRYWKCANSGVVSSCKVFIWDDELEGHPPYVRKISSKPRTPVVCNCSEVVKDLANIMKESESRKNEELEMKLDIERNKGSSSGSLLLNILALAGHLL
ncbi:hypothetical protein KIW84_023302 [Lathyrus oleraceus]|uniref:Uncharacterized protein n=1 Tax=Pisum sativum TaxID=3888 RepID=A0A9D4YCM0_PEA|nr:hypothetical protein KIW84_023302 [Pisum sativum]